MRVIDKSLASIYDATKVYNIDDIVLFGNKIYSCITNNTTGEFNSDNWEQTYLVDVLESSANSTFINSLAPEYDNTTTYEVGSKVLYNRRLYRCITAVTTAEDFDESKWEQMYLSDYVIVEDTSNLNAYTILIKGADVRTTGRNGSYCTDENVIVEKNSALTGIIFTFPRNVSKFVYYYIYNSGNPWYLNNVELAGSSVDSYYYKGEITFDATNSVTLIQKTASDGMQIHGHFE